jgi:hypothetical protein
MQTDKPDFRINGIEKCVALSEKLEDGTLLCPTSECKHWIPRAQDNGQYKNYGECATPSIIDLALRLQIDYLENPRH